MTPCRPLIVDLPGWRDPLDVLRASRGMPRAALLWSGTRDPELGRYSFFAADPYLSVSWKAGSALTETRIQREELEVADPFGWLRSLLAVAGAAEAPGWPFPGGAIGYFSYDAGRALERIPERAADDRGFPWVDFSFYRWAVNWDHEERRWSLIVGAEPAELAGREAPPPGDLAGQLAAWLERPAERAAPARPGGTRGAAQRVSLDAAAYVAAVADVQERIREGDCYEVNLSRRITIEAAPDPRDLFLALSRESPAPFAAYVETGAGVLAGSSPERFLRVARGRAESRPIKGTAARHEDPAEDAAAGRRLTESAKDRAENVMIVDLVRNDLGRVCEPGSVSVPALCRLESYAGVHHLVSTITGRLAEGRDALDAVRALFPPGSMTGAPKISAMCAIEALEPVRRGPYAGAVGYFTGAGACDLSVIIRSFLVSGAGVDLQVGGAVVSDSDPEAELAESVLKGERAMEALRGGTG